MKADELRIGNWVAEGQNYFKVRLIDYRYGEYWVGSNDIEVVKIDRLNHIPLTNKILEKAGFDWCDSKWTGKPQKLSIQISNLETLDYEDDEFHICGVANHDVVTFWYEIKYLHQLQNLYFALTREELQIIL